MIIDATDYELEPTPWAARAACRGIAEPDLFFPPRGTAAHAAKAVCAECPVQRECLDYAIRWRIDHGIWGGLAPRERWRRYRATPPPRARHLPPRHGTTSRYHTGCRCQRCVEAQMAYLTDSR